MKHLPTAVLLLVVTGITLSDGQGYDTNSGYIDGKNTML